ncbi:putative ribosome recycling factor [Lupinus albus]|uniref:Ribosome-recycling factor, chloroplastic n=1 Tax=Lupinus albus TaxID=3870 RepID=A0A6A4PTA4_LUPAL|nr:putative ribosome recycling factor [Lupinus albus]
MDPLSYANDVFYVQPLLTRLQSLKTKKPLLRMMLMEKTIENIRSNFNSIRTDKSNSTMLDKIEVEYYGSLVNLKSIAQISTPDANSLLVQPYYKSSLHFLTGKKEIQMSMIPNN